MTVVDWLRQIGLEEYSQLFAEHHISAEVLPHLTADDLKDLGITSVGHRRRLLVEIEALRAAAAPNEDRTPGSMPLDAAPAERGPVPAATSERRQITVLFCDIVGSTPLVTRLDPEEMRELLRTYQTNVTAAVTATGGYVARVIGDGLLVYFGWPHADEAHAESAVRAALAIIETTGTHQVSIRVGIASGLVLIGDLLGAGAVPELMAVGETLHLAARLQAMAEPATIVVSDATHALVSSLFEMEDLGPVELKGFTVPQRSWRVRRETALSGRSEAQFAGMLAPIVGREAELEALLHQWRQTVAGNGRVVLVSGEPGIGKSRLLAGLEERLTDEKHLSLRYFCSPYHQDDALYPFIARWEQELGFARADTPEDRFRKLETNMASRGLEPDDIPLLAAMLSIPLGDRYPRLDLSPQRQKEKTFDMLIGWLQRLASARPVLVLFEDAHWADPTTLELLEAGIDHMAGLPVLRIISFRPEFSPPWIGRPNVNLLKLGRLDRDASAILANQVAAQQVLPPLLRERIIRETDGIPLFIEEMTKAVLEEAGGKPAATDVITVPSTLQGSLMARLDRLPAAKQVAQLGAVIGRNFPHALLAAISDLAEPLLAQGLHELVVSGLAFQRGVAPEAVYAFKHALIRDVAYESLPRNRRAEIHSAVVAAVEANRGLGSMEPSRLGHHCAQAGLIAKAASCYRRAGERAAARAGLAETRNHLERGLQFARSLPDGADRQLLEAELLIALGRQLMAMKGQSDPEAGSLFQRAVEVCREMADPEMLARAMFALGAVAMSRGELPSVQTISDDLLGLAKSHQNARIAIAGHIRLGILAFYQGRLEASRNSLSRVLNLCGEADREVLDLAVTSSPDVAAAAYLANALAHLGYADRAIEYAKQAVERARPLGVASLAFSMALSTAARAFQILGDETRCRRYAETLVIAAREQGFPQYLALGRCVLGWLTAKQKNVTDGLKSLTEAKAALQALGSQREMPYLNCLTAEALVWAGRRSEAMAVLDETLLASSRSGAAAFDARILAMKGAVLSGSGDNDAAAEVVFRQAIDVARQQSAKLFELQACTGLARVRLRQGRPTDARNLLGPVYAWFAEGSTLPDLREAREVLAL